jgi:hypothetical protein
MEAGFAAHTKPEVAFLSFLRHSRIEGRKNPCINTDEIFWLRKGSLADGGNSPPQTCLTATGLSSN